MDLFSYILGRAGGGGSSDAATLSKLRKQISELKAQNEQLESDYSDLERELEYAYSEVDDACMKIFQDKLEKYNFAGMNFFTYKPREWTHDKLIDPTTGEYYDYEYASLTTYIPVEQREIDTEYESTGQGTYIFEIAYYDADKNFISAHIDHTISPLPEGPGRCYLVYKKSFTPPAGTAFIRLGYRCSGALHEGSLCYYGEGGSVS